MRTSIVHGITPYTPWACTWSWTVHGIGRTTSPYSKQMIQDTERDSIQLYWSGLQRRESDGVLTDHCAEVQYRRSSRSLVPKYAGLDMCVVHANILGSLVMRQLHVHPHHATFCATTYGASSAGTRRLACRTHVGARPLLRHAGVTLRHVGVTLRQAGVTRTPSPLCAQDHRLIAGGTRSLTAACGPLMTTPAASRSACRWWRHSASGQHDDTARTAAQCQTVSAARRMLCGPSHHHRAVADCRRRLARPACLNVPSAASHSC